jgi:hypothetical protein
LDLAAKMASMMVNGPCRTGWTDAKPFDSIKKSSGAKFLILLSFRMLSFVAATPPFDSDRPAFPCCRSPGRPPRHGTRSCGSCHTPVARQQDPRCSQAGLAGAQILFDPDKRLLELFHLVAEISSHCESWRKNLSLSCFIHSFYFLALHSAT